jgi:hypothetical protein
MTTDLALATQTQANPEWGDALQAVLKKGSMRGLLPLQSVDDESLYALGHSLYTEGNYKPAAFLFALLFARDAFERRYLHAYACCLQMMGRHAMALPHHLTAAQMDPSDPASVFHACECLIATGRADLAYVGLTKLQLLCVPGQHDQILCRARGLLDLMSPQSQPLTEREGI